MTSTPLGKYTELIASIISLAIIGVTLAAYLIYPNNVPGLLSDAFWVCLGVIFGARAATNGAGKMAAAAHMRLDAIGAPAADLSLLAGATGKTGATGPAGPAGHDGTNA
jgi:hypothetical protein